MVKCLITLGPGSSGRNTHSCIKCQSRCLVLPLVYASPLCMTSTSVYDCKESLVSTVVLMFSFLYLLFIEIYF
jgi:hypothetical protein